jgi:hypothetical protein
MPTFWRPQGLESTQPLAPRLRRWVFGLAAVAGFALAGLWLAVGALGAPSSATVAPAATEQVVLERLARTDLPVWDPGVELPPTETPEYLPPPAPPIADRPHPEDPPVPNVAAEALRRIETAVREGETLPAEAVALLYRAADDTRASWLLSYGTGIAFLRSDGFADQARFQLDRAQVRIESYEVQYARQPTHHAASAVTRYASGHATLRSDCVGAIQDFKLAVSALNRYVASGGAAVVDRKQPFPLDPFDLESLDVWMALAWGYVECEGRYPAEYVRRLGREVDWSAEYSTPDHPEIENGPFPAPLARCVETGGASSRCWALSNLNKLWIVNRRLVEGDPERLDRRRRDALARLAYDVAYLAATGDGEEATDGSVPSAAGEILRRARALARGTSDEALAAAIDRFGRHLATEGRDFTAFAEPYRGLAPAAMPFSADNTPEEVKGMAWALRERWQGHLAARSPGRIFEEVAVVRGRVPDAHLDSLAAWEASARAALREALADEIRVQKKRDAGPLAAGLRDFRAGYLGPEWPDRAESAWWTPGLTAAKWGLVALYGLFLVALAVVFRKMIRPYVLYTTDFYRTEMARRFEERRAKDLPVTGEEIYRWRRERAGRSEV